MTKPLVFLSPHLDDVVFSCGEMLQQCDDPVVVTIFAGTSDTATYAEMNAMGRRCAEDLRAAEKLHFDPKWLPLPEVAFRSEPVSVYEISNAIEPWVAEADVVFAPVGLHHPDHVLLSDAAAQVTQRLGVRFVAYEELPYRVEMPIETMKRLSTTGLLESADCDVPARGDLKLKLAAIREYTSQMKGRDVHSLLVPERFWRVRMQA